MRSNNYKTVLGKAAAAVAVLLASSAAMAQVNLTAAPTTALLPDGSAVNMWGYSCGTAPTTAGFSCAPLNPAAKGWSPVVITVPSGSDLSINLTNNLSFANSNTVPTSLVIVGQLGGGLGDKNQEVTVPSPDHSNAQANVAWPIAGAAGNPGTPPAQGPRVQSFGTEVAAGSTATLTWKAPRQGTYLLESGTHPSIQGPMGLYGIVVVTSAPSATSSTGTAYPNITYNAELPLLLSEIDPIQNTAVTTAVNTAGFSETAVIGPNPTGPVVSIGVLTGGSGYTSAPTVTLSPPAQGGVQATATATIDTNSTSPTFGQVLSVTVTNSGSGYIGAPTVTFSGGGLGAVQATASAVVNAGADSAAHCSEPAGAASGAYASACYPPAVNYTPLYYLINGVAFDKTNASGSLFAATPGSSATPVSGKLLVRFVNAGLRMHVPSIVGSVTSGTVATVMASTSGMSLVAEDGNPMPGLPRVQNEVFMAAGKTFDAVVDVPAAGSTALPVYDRELSLSANATTRDAGMLAYISINGSGTPSAPAFKAAVANPDSYSTVVAGRNVIVSDTSKGLLANDVNVTGTQVAVAPTHGTVALNTNGTFTYVPDSSWASTTTPTTSDTFTYCGNGVTFTNPTPAACATVTLNACGTSCTESASAITLNDDAYASTIASSLSVKSPGVLANDKDSMGYPLSVVPGSYQFVSGPGALTVTLDPSGAFNATAAAPGTYKFTYQAKNSQGTVSTAAATVSVTFPNASNLHVSVVDGKDGTPITDYRWIIEEDRTFYVDPTKTTNNGGNSIVPTFGTNFHTSFMPVVATGCTGTLSCESGQTLLGQPAVCDGGNGVCRTTDSQQVAVDPGQVYLDPTKRYYISVLPGDAATPFISTNFSPSCANGSSQTGATNCGHGMGGAPIAAGQTSVKILAQPSPYPPAKLSVFVFEDDFPLNGEQDAGGGVDVLAPNEPGLGGFNIQIMDDAGGPGDPTGQVDYDMFNQPLSNSLAGTPDPANHGIDACPITKNGNGITGMIVTCPKYEADGKTLSPLAGQAVVANMMPGRYGVIATPGADRIGRGEQWLQTNTLDGQKAHDSFLRIGEPSYFQEYGPAGYHVTIGFANPAIINARLKSVCNGTDINVTGTNCTNTVKGKVTTERMSRTPDERLYSSGSRKSFAFTQCYVSVGDPDGEDFAFGLCDADGNFQISGLPDGNWRVTTFDQWNDQLVDGLSTPVQLGGGKTIDMGDIAANQWQANFFTRTFIDTNKDGVSNLDAGGNPTEPGLALVKTNVRFRDGSFSNRNNTDLNGFAAFNEEFPLFNWYVIETDVTRFKNTGTHVVYDAGGPADGTNCGTNGTPPCGGSTIADHLANTLETVGLPTDLRVPGAVYCDTADCTGLTINSGPISGGSSGPGGSTGRIDPPWVLTEGWQGFSGQNNFLEFGKTPYVPGENGGIRGHVVYSSTRPFDDPQFNTQNVWEPLVPGVTINLYKETTAADGTTALTLVDTTKTSSWDDWAQGFRSDGKPNMNCPGQSTTDLFYFSLYNQPDYLDTYNAQHNGTTAHTLPYNSQYKCYDGMHNWNQLQPAPYDGMYQFPSVTGMDPVTGKPTGTNCTACTTNPDASDPYRYGQAMLPAGKYVVEVVVPPGYELVKEEDKNILVGDNFIAPATLQFPGLGSAIYIIPDQAELSSYNANSSQNATNSMGRTQDGTSHEGDTPTLDTFWPCVGATRVVPDFISLFPQSAEVAPFAGATRNLCDRKEVTLDDQTSLQAEFFVFTSTHAAAHFAGVITDDFTSEFDPYSPQFGEKFAPADLPVAIKDWTGTEISRIYADHWGAYNGLTYSTWEVNPPNPTGYSPTMMITCMNDAGNGSTPDPLYNPGYSQFCYEIPFMPGATQYMDTPVVPTSAFAGAGYNNPDCAYPDATPSISEVDGMDASNNSVIGPWVSAAGKTLTIKSLGTQMVNNNAYSGPSAAASPFNQKKTQRTYGFGNTQGSVTIGVDGAGKPLNAPVTGWTDTQITVIVPSGIQACAVQQQVQYGGSSALCGQLVVTRGDNGKQSIDTVTVTVGGKTPTHVPTDKPTIQAAIDAAAPGDMIIVNPGVYSEMLLMWKPVRLQGVGAASSVLNANTHPAGKLDPWRREVNCLFGLALDGQPVSDTHPYDPTGAYSSSCQPGSNGSGMMYLNGATKSVAKGFYDPQVDRLPLEGILGWDTTVNGNLAQLLQEPTLMGAYEGAGITVLAKGVNIPKGSANVFGSGSESAFPTGTVLLTDSARDCGHGVPGNRNFVANPYPSNFQCNPSSIDGLSVTNSSQGGGGIFVHAWGHNLQIANNRVMNNTGTLTGGITIGQGESPDAYLQGTPADSDPGSCESGGPANSQLPYCFDLNVNVHHNAVTLNSSIGDELYSSTPAGGGGVTICTGADYYKFNYNWVCGNLSSGDGGGLVHLGFIKNGDIEHNSILFNQSTNPTVPANGGGLIVMGAPPDGLTANGTECGNTAADADCTPGLSDGTGPDLVINANLILGNAADSGSGGGIRLQGVNGTEVSAFPKRPGQWNDVTITNNIIANNVAGWDGAGISMQDALRVRVINNTIMSNDTTASSGVLFNTLGAPLASSQGPGQTTADTTTSLPQPAGLVTMQHSAVLASTLPASLTVTCPAGNAVGLQLNNGACKSISYPLLYNNVFWQNRAFYIGVGDLGADQLNQQNLVTLYNAFGTTAAVSQPQAAAWQTNGNGGEITGGTGACVSPASYWDIGVRGDRAPANHTSGWTLAPTYSVLTDAGDYPDANNEQGGKNTGSNPDVISQYCNGSRVPPELGSMGYQVPPGISDATVPNPVFNLTPAATVDEGNNWINLNWGPLALTNATTGITLGNYGPATGSPVINYVPATAISYALAPSTDFYGNPRKTDKAVDAGAVEYVSPVVTGGPLNFGNVAIGSTSAAQTLTLTNPTATGLTGINVNVSAPFALAGTAQGGPGTCGTTLGAGGSCTINIVFAPTTGGPASGTATITANVTISGSPVSLTGTGMVVSASVAPNALAFGNWRVNTSSNAMSVTVTNTGTVPLTGGVFTVSGAGFTKAAGAQAGTCTGNLGVGNSCTVNVLFKPTATGPAAGTLTVAYTGATVTPSTVTLSGVGVVAAGTVLISPNPQTITLPHNVSSGVSSVTLTNTQPPGGASVAITSVSASGGSFFSYFFTVGVLAAPGDTCTGANLAPGASCTIPVRFTNVTSPRGTKRNGTITFTDTASGSPQSGGLIGFATP